LEALYAGLVRIAALPDKELHALVQSLWQTPKAPLELERSASRTTSSVTLPRPSCHTAVTPSRSLSPRAFALLLRQTVGGRISIEVRRRAGGHPARA
jgi:hypothetical protein